MAKKQKKPQLWRWALAAGLILALAVGLALALKPKAPDPIPEYGQGVPGIDVSSHQGDIDWQAVADSGVEFAMIRLGYRGYDSGTLHIDEKARQNLDGAKAAGLQVGAYFFSQAVNAQEAREEAALALEVLDGRALELPLVYDWEYVSLEARTGFVSGGTLEDCIRAFCGEVETAGHKAMIYFNQDLANTRLELEELEEYDFWLAMYSDELEFRHQVDMWQYSDQGTVPGIEADVDLNWYYPG